MLRVQKPVSWENVEYSGYEVYSIEWILGKDEFYVCVVYFSGKKKYHKLVKHRFQVGNNVDIDEMIKMVHKLHP